MVGREHDIAEITKLILTENGPQVIAVVGMGGMGKTLLVIERCVCVNSQPLFGKQLTPIDVSCKQCKLIIPSQDIKQHFHCRWMQNLNDEAIEENIPIRVYDREIEREAEDQFVLRCQRFHFVFQKGWYKFARRKGLKATPWWCGGMSFRTASKSNASDRVLLARLVHRGNKSALAFGNNSALAFG